MKSEESKSAFTFNMLLDEPASAEELRTAEFNANTLATLLKQTHNDRAIGLFGPVGSGKSSTIELLRSKLSPNEHCFVFDAWLDSDEPLRKRFLEKLIRFLAGSRLLPSCCTKHFIDRVRLKVYSKQTTNRAKPPLVAILMLASLAMVPSSQFIVTRYQDQVIVPELMFVATLGLFAPIVLLFFLFLIIPLRFTFNLLIGADLPTSYGLGALTSKSDTEVETSTTETPEMSALEYEELFNEVLDESLPLNKRLYIVVDNLDRLEDKQLSESWLVIRSFMEVAKSRVNVKWVISVDCSKTSPVSNAKGKFLIDQYSKSFASSVHVPQPLYSRWTEYYHKAYLMAFPSDKDESAEVVLRVFNCICDNAEMKSPRFVKTFINELGSIRMKSLDGVSLPSQALFTAWLLKNNFRLSPQVLEDKIPDDINCYFTGDTVSELCSLLYSLPPNEAQEHFIEARIESVLSERSGRFEAVIGMPGFWKFLNANIDRYIVEWQKGSYSLIRLINGLSSVDLLNEDGRQVLLRLVDGLPRRKVFQYSDELVIALNYVLINYHDNQVLKKIVSCLVRALLSDADGTDADGTDREPKVRQVLDLIERYCLKCGFESDLTDQEYERLILDLSLSWILARYSARSELYSAIWGANGNQRYLENIVSLLKRRALVSHALVPAIVLAIRSCRNQNVIDQLISELIEWCSKDEENSSSSALICIALHSHERCLKAVKEVIKLDSLSSMIATFLSLNLFDEMCLCVLGAALKKAPKGFYAELTDAHTVLAALVNLGTFKKVSIDYDLHAALEDPGLQAAISELVRPA